MLTRSLLLLRRRAAAAVIAAAVPPNYSNTPYTDAQSGRATADLKRKRHGTLPAPKEREAATGGAPLRSSPGCLLPGALLPPPMRPAFIDSSRTVTNLHDHGKLISFRRAARGSSDVSMRPLPFLELSRSDARGGGRHGDTVEHAQSFGERLRDELSCRWAAKFYGQVTFGPRNYPYPSSRWLARRFKMKKHRIIKRFRFRRYKLAAVANLPFARMIRVGMLPELKSSKTKKGDAVDADLSAQLISAVKGTAGGKTKGKRTRPKSKYQV